MATKNPTTQGKTRKPVSKKVNVTEEDVRRKAQEIYEKRVQEGIPGDPHSDWLKAESQLKKGKS